MEGSHVSPAGEDCLIGPLAFIPRVHDFCVPWVSVHFDYALDHVYHLTQALDLLEEETDILLELCLRILGTMMSAEH